MVSWLEAHRFLVTFSAFFLPVSSMQYFSQSELEKSNWKLEIKL